MPYSLTHISSVSCNGYPSIPSHATCPDHDYRNGQWRKTWQLSLSPSRKLDWYDTTTALRFDISRSNPFSGWVLMAGQEKRNGYSLVVSTLSSHLKEIPTFETCRFHAYEREIINCDEPCASELIFSFLFFISYSCLAREKLHLNLIVDRISRQCWDELCPGMVNCMGPGPAIGQSSKTYLLKISRRGQEIA